MEEREREDGQKQEQTGQARPAKPANRRRTPKAMMRGLRVDIAEMPANVKYIEADLDTFSDLKKLKAWLKDHRIVGRNEPCPCGSGKKYKKYCATA